ncbi:GNAT family N-acetyltransferase [Hoyosella sp. YIM 151337]|uniref:GNAT family N-acetyltransferase n=1 Tax=Hoyosella sp. YIM 151337 TaxID=2992742 RepID=UPI0022358918|nr:GNAT family N-acetyltransferase [Hoyosella sp. YIM 151337]MCW4353275.1 GNAT family N-acetyltransferase [Hoyosella sp. YIM 151337]
MTETADTRTSAPRLSVSAPSGPTVIQRATALDAAEIAYVAAITFPLACPPHSHREDMAAFITSNLSPAHFGAYLSDPACAVFVARTESEITGYTLIKTGPPAADAECELPPGLALELSKIYVLPGHHGTGTSAQLMGAAVQHARNARASTLWLGVNSLNERAQRFYRKCGFTYAGTRTFTVGSQTEHDFIFALNLSSAAPDV